MTSKTLVPLAAAALLAGLTSTAAAQKKPKAPKACGITAIPLVVGNKWVYEQVAHPTPLDAAQSRLVPTQAKTVTITVDAVETKDTTTTVKLTEVVAIPISVVDPSGKSAPPRYEEKKVESTITCTATTLSVSPDSFWFSGEPGGFWNVEMTGLERKGQTLAIANGKMSGAEWQDDVKAKWKRIATPGSEAELGSGSFDIKRRVVFTADESVTSLAGVYNAKKIGIETKGEVAVDESSGKPYLLPDGLVSFFWLVDGVGIVQVHNSFVQAFQLKEFAQAK